MEKGKNMYIALQKQANATPFETSDLIKATSTMLQFGIAQKDVM